MPIQASEIKLYRAGAAGLGGAVSAVDFTNMFDTVLAPEAQNGDAKYRCGYFVNTGSIAWDEVVAWISANTPSPTTVVEIGVGTSAVNGTEQTVANEQTAPVDVTFFPAATKAAGVALGNLPAGGRRAVWFKRTINPGTAARLADTWTVNVEGSSV